MLFVGTKRQAAEVVREEAIRAGQFFSTGRWLGGTLTNFRTMKNGIDRLRDIEQERSGLALRSVDVRRIFNDGVRELSIGVGFTAVGATVQ